MQRVLTTVTILGLLVATAAAFAITEHLKLIKSPIYGTRVTKLISPTCRCATAHATVSFRLRRSDRVTVKIVDRNQRTVATLASGKREPKGRVTFRWDGSTDAGVRVPDGAYRPEIHVSSTRQKILLSYNTIVVDTGVPKVLAASAARGLLTPGRHRAIAIRYTLSEPAHVAVFLGNRRVVLGHRSKPHGVVKWGGKVDGRVLREGRYVLSIGSVDLAGNVTPAAQRKTVRVVIRFIALAAHRVGVHPRARFSIGVETGAPRFTWRLGRAHGTARGKKLHLRAPAKKGKYRLVVAEDGHQATAVVSVRPR